MGVARYAAQNGWHLNGEMAITGQIPRGWHGDGIITLLDEREDVADFVRQAKLPVVDLSMMRLDIEVPRVSGDHRAIGRVAGELFKERGFLHYAWFSAHDDPVSQLREKGFLEVVESQALTLQSWFYQAAVKNRGNDWALKSAWLVKRLKALPKPAAVFAFHDAEAANVLDACLRAGIRVPEQVAILGVDNNPMICESLRVPLSSVNHDLERLGYAGSGLLDGLMNGIIVPGNPIIIPPRGVTERQSTDALAVTHEAVRLALEFMRRNHARMIGPEDAARVSGRPRSYLEAEFRKLFKHSMRQELACIRLKCAKSLLIETDLSVTEIAARSGFNTAQYFNNVFRRETGLTPLSYRLEHTAAFCV